MIRNIVYQIVSFIVLGLVAVSCSDDLVEGVKVPGGQDDFWSQFDFVIADNTDTRVSYDTYKRSTFEAGDEVGIYVVDDNGTLISGQPTNVHYVVRDVTDLNTGERRQVLLPSDPNTSVGKDANYHYILYYPYNVNMTLTALKSYTHTVDTDQNASSSTYVPELTAFEHSDLLWCYYTPPTGTQTFEVYFDHAMAQIVVELDESEVYAPDDNTENTGVYLLNMPMQASNINLLQSWSEEFGYATTVPTYDANSADKNPKIHAWKFGTGASGKLQFRAMVPAHTIKYQDEQSVKRPVVRIYSSQDSYTDYYLKSDLDLKPGYTYTFTFSKGQTTTDFEVSEDDSWVLDVLDPETGAPVGLLCREYLRYQPSTNFDGTYNLTGQSTTNTDGSATKFIDSQAWVFYNLRTDGTPDLSKGKVLRFIYDIQLNANNNNDENAFNVSQAYAPKPHMNSLRLGIFTPEHGYYWTTQNHVDYLDEGQYGTEIKKEGSTDKRENYQNYGMHGGTITWGYADGHSYISSFTLPAHNAYESSETATVNGVVVTVGDGSGYITNKQAYYFGHIAIDADGADISYRPISDDNKDIDGKKVGILQPHYLIDRRINASGTVEENRYPLVKIGHNQFWMSKSLRTNILTDGTVIPCYNKITTDGTKPAAMKDGLNWNDEFGMGYVYPFSSSIKNGNSPYDPVNDEKEMHPGLPVISRGNTQEFVPAPCYNLSVVNDDRFVPKSNDNRLYYVMPDKSTFNDMAGYFSERFTAKLCSNQIKLRRGNDYLLENGSSGTNAELLYDAALYGMTYSNDGTLANYSAANISGFNARAIGYYYSSTAAVNGFSAMTGSVAFILKNTQSSGVEYMSLPIYSPFAYADFDKCYQHSYYSPSTYPTHFFAQVRMVMKYRNQLDNSGAASFVQGLYSSRSTDPVPQTMKGSRVVRVEMEK